MNMNSFGKLTIFAIGAAAFYIYRSHKRKVDYEFVWEVSQTLKGKRTYSAFSCKVNSYNKSHK